VAAAPGDAAAHNDLAVANVALMAKSMEIRQRAALTRTSLEHMEQAVKLQPGSAFYALNLAHMYADAQRPEAALDLAQQALGLLDAGVEDPADPLCLAFPFAWNEQRVQFSTVYNLTRALPEGFAALQRCLMLYRGGLLLGRLADQQGMGALAMLGYRVAVAARPDLGTGRVELARALAAAGEDEEALRHVQMGVETDPFLTRGWLLQVELLLRLGREAEARRFVGEHLTILDAVAPRQGVQGLSRALAEWDEVRQALQEVRFEDAVAA
jgi:tetratricopeptide (TPR) repeat protein